MENMQTKQSDNSELPCYTERYFIVADVLEYISKEGYIVMFGNPNEAIGTKQAEFRTLQEAKHYLKQHTVQDEPVYRVFLARRHGSFSIKRIKL